MKQDVSEATPGPLGIRQPRRRTKRGLCSTLSVEPARLESRRREVRNGHAQHPTSRYTASPRRCCVKPNSVPHSDDSASRMRARLRIAWMAAAALVSLLVIGTGLTHVSGSPTLCASCHEMAPAVATWRTSPHANVACPSCHETQRPWYRFPETLAFRAVMLKRDVIAHVSAGSAETTNVPGLDWQPIPDSVCQSCHDLSRTVTVPPGILIDHPKHVERNKSCTSCHLLTAHPGDESERRLALMAQCFQCHGAPTTPKALGACDVCHPPSFNLRPNSHEPAMTWRARHGKRALADRRLCSYCHREDFCGDCHGLDMPHPSGWAKGTAGHAAIAPRERKMCVRCHDEKPDFCSACHHKDYDAAKGSWVVQHRFTVKQKGTSFCLDCHTTVFCPYCHTRARVKSALATAQPTAATSTPLP